MWESKFVSPDFAVEGVFRMVKEWREARKLHLDAYRNNGKADKRRDCTWTPPEIGVLKLNVDASVFPRSGSFSIGMIIRSHQGSFMAVRTITISFSAPLSVFEAETIGIKEALSCLEVQQLGHTKVQIEMDFLISERDFN